MSEIRQFLNEVRECANAMAETGIHLCRGLAEFYIADRLYARAIQLSSVLVETPQAMQAELDEFDQLADSTSIDPALWEDVPTLLMRRIWLPIPEFRKLMDALQQDLAAYPQSNRAALFIAESVDDVVTRCGRLQDMVERM